MEKHGGEVDKVELKYDRQTQRMRQVTLAVLVAHDEGAHLIDRNLSGMLKRGSGFLWYFNVIHRVTN